MMLNTDDTPVEQYMNSMHRETDTMINCEKCARLFFIDHEIGRKKFINRVPLLCTRCNKEAK